MGVGLALGSFQSPGAALKTLPDSMSWAYQDGDALF